MVRPSPRVSYYLVAATAAAVVSAVIVVVVTTATVVIEQTDHEEDHYDPNDPGKTAAYSGVTAGIASVIH